MMRVTIAILPGGDPDRAQVIDTIDVVNVSGLDVEVADYLVNDRWKVAHRRSFGARVLAAKAVMKVESHSRRSVGENDLSYQFHQMSIDEVLDDPT